MKPITRFFFTLLFGISLSILAILLAQSQTVVAAPQVTIRYVATTGSDTTDCTYSATPCATIQYAVDQAGAGDEVRVAGGEYMEVNNDGGLSQIVYITKSITVCGGYTVTNWTNPDPEANLTTLNPQGQGRGIYIAGTTSVKIEGIRVINGDASGLGGGQFATVDNGGGLYVISATATLLNNDFISNLADVGGGVSVRNGILLSTGNVYSDNLAVSYEGGGGLFIQNTDATLIGESFHDNTGLKAGAGMYVRDSSVNISNSLFDGNRIAQTTGSNGGAIYLSGSTGILQNNTFMNNAAYGGGAIYLLGGTATLENNQIAMNTASSGGGGLLSEHCNLTLQANEIISNTASRGGGLSFIANSFTNRQVSMTGNLIAHNSATQWGGGICIDAEVVFTSTNDLIVDNQAGFYGSGVFMGLFGGGETRFVNSTIAHNTGGYGIGLINVGSQVWLTNTILVSHTIGIWIDSPGVAHTEAMLWGNEMNVVLTNTTITTGTINLYGNPAFLDPANGDYHLSPDSLAIDAGIDAGIATDLDGDTRPQGAGFDMGADEFVPVFAPSGVVQLQGRDDASGAVVSAWSGGTIVATATTDSSGAYLLTLPDGTYTLTVEMPLYLDARQTNVTISNSSPFSLTPVTLKGGDVNESDTINILDLVVIGAHYNLTCGDPDWDARADINGDCEVNLLDLVFAAGNFGKSSPVGW